MATFIDTLVSGRADKTLAHSEDIFDVNVNLHQDEINAQLLNVIKEISDIQDVLNSKATNKALSANQGRILKALLDAKVIQVGGVPWDAVPTKDSNHAITSGGVFDALESNKAVYLTQDEYDALVIQGSIDPNKDYNIYEEDV